ncbi:uncharacterized protein LOC124421264 [Lucilia cuprina]|uniref:uncharacterized protein LOC124421264 n=1 Tax=Lucilia cuprina TaxID=7375 RepID=UPI001F056E40|nr:uncharacterized protein LOC124421264 [Lucilia cuprina]KAI8124254.1 hypothetical protein CVS40_5180 [Lucilia cuprina]
MSEILNIDDKPFSDEDIVKRDYHSYVPYIQSFKNNDEIRITIQNQDLYILPSESYLYIEGNLKTASGENATNGRLRNNCVGHMFDEIRYEINGIEIDRTRYLGITSQAKNYISLNSFESNMMSNAGWSTDGDFSSSSFNYCVPLNRLLGFAEDFNKVICNSKHDLILLRSSKDVNACYSTDAKEEISLSITNIVWKVQHIHLSDYKKIQFMKTIKDGKSLPIAFRSWDCYYNPTFPGGMKHSWNVKLSTNRERPRFVVFIFEKDNKFVHSDLSNIKVHLNSDTYPYDDLNLKFDDNRYAILYDMYAKFQQNYYMKEPQPLLSFTEFKENPIAVIDISNQNESIKGGPIDLKIQFETRTSIPKNTSAYCLILHDRLIEYSPLTGIVRKIV